MYLCPRDLRLCAGIDKFDCTIQSFNIQLDSVPYFWNSTDISGLLVWQHKSKVVAARPKDGIRWVSAWFMIAKMNIRV